MLEGAGFAYAAVVLFVAGVAHGVSGFGFPLISTPMVALVADVRTAVLVTLLPNIAINLLSAFGSGWRESLRRHWDVPVYVLVGTVVGTQVVIYAPANPLRVFLAAVIVLYLLQERFRRIDWGGVVRHPRASALAAGLLAGFLSGTVNVMLPPLLIYFSVLGLAQAAMTQVMNACFLVGKVTQAATFAAHGQLGVATVQFALPLCAVALIGYAIGRRLAPRVQPHTYKRMIRGVLWVMAVLLLAQALVL